MKKSIALILTVVALAAMTITAGASEATALDMQQYTVQSYTEAEYNTTPDGMTSVLFRPLTRNISPVPDTALEEVSEFGLEPVYFTGTQRASAHRFTNVSIGSSKPSDMTFICEDVVYQRLGSIIVSGSASKTSATLSAEVYRLYNGEWTRVGSYSNISGSNGQFSFSHPLGTDGDYGIKIWHDLPGSTVTISGNRTY